jgi:TPR repeat protein
VGKKVKVSKQYDRALKLAQRQSVPSREVYNLLVKADALGDARATYAIATWYLHGSPFTKVSFAKAASLLRRAAEGGVSEAAFDLAVSYEIGAGIKKSLPKAFEYYVRAALLGDSKAHYEVSRMYFYGFGVKRSRGLADAWRSKAAQLGVEEAK